METLLAIVIGGLYTAGFYSMLRRSIVKLVIGLMFISHATNLLIFTAGGLTRGLPPLVETGRHISGGAIADPLPQALTLTAIVISFGITAFTLVLVLKAFNATGTKDLDQMKGGES
jgi:multicomponent Na+:H+ antiporter subunit C